MTRVFPKLARVVSGVLALGALVACTEAETGPDTPVAISFDSLPSPSIVIGDTLRDAAGLVAPFEATVYNGQGNPILDAPVRWFSLTRDTLNRITNDTVVLAVDSITGIAVAPAPSTEAIFYARRNVTATVVPQVGRLPGPSRQIPLTLPPDRLTGPERIDTVVRNRDADLDFLPSAAFTVSVQHDSAGLGTSFLGVRSWRVRFALEYHGALLTDSTIAWVAHAAGTRVSPDTITDASGNASRRIWINEDNLVLANPDAADSIVVLVTATWKPGAPIAGSPLRVTVPIAPPPPLPAGLRQPATGDPRADRE